MEERRKEYVYPPVELLNEYEGSANGSEKLNGDKKIIVEKLAELGVVTEVIGAVETPAYLRYDLALAPNVSVRRVQSYSTDIALALKLDSDVDVQANFEIGAISVYVPKKKRSVVGLRSVMESSAFKNAKREALTFAVGNGDGGIVCGSMAKWTHLLVGGIAGSGKSCFLNSLILSLAMTHTPNELRFILIDPKGVEFGVYNNLPHLMLNEIITDSTTALAALEWAIAEMERRYSLFDKKTIEDRAVRNIDEYNSAVNKESEKLAKIVIVIDELADLMLVARRDTENAIARLAAKSRACGIHLVLSTQRPYSDVLTGIIRANIPTRIAFKCVSASASAFVVDESGAEELWGNGDMLYKSAHMFAPARVQGAFVSEKEIERVVKFIKNNNELHYDISLADILKFKRPEKQEEEQLSLEEEILKEELPRYIEALRFVAEKGEASISMLQRRFHFGYNTAGRAVEWMESNGYVGPFVGAVKREVLITKEQFEREYGEESPKEEGVKKETMSKDNDYFLRSVIDEIRGGESDAPTENEPPVFHTEINGPMRADENGEVERRGVIKDETYDTVMEPITDEERNNFIESFREKIAEQEFVECEEPDFSNLFEKIEEYCNKIQFNTLDEKSLSKVIRILEILKAE